MSGAGRLAIVALPVLSADATVELPCVLAGRLTVPGRVEPMPAAAMAILEPVVHHQGLAADGALGGDRTTLLEAMPVHPLGPARARAVAMLDAILATNQSIERAAA